MVNFTLRKLLYVMRVKKLGEQQMAKGWIKNITLFCFMVILCLGCDTNTLHKGKRDKSNDSICTPNNQQAYTFEDPDDALSADCSSVRQHQGKIDPETGKMEHIEMLIWCCPQ